jgi:hypothetical protein
VYSEEVQQESNGFLAQMQQKVHHTALGFEYEIGVVNFRSHAEGVVGSLSHDETCEGYNELS